MLLRLAEAVGRVVLAGRELVRLSGWVDHMITRCHVMSSL